MIINWLINKNDLIELLIENGCLWMKQHTIIPWVREVAEKFVV